MWKKYDRAGFVEAVRVADTMKILYSLLNMTEEWWTYCQERMESYLGVMPNDWQIKA